MTSTSAAKAEGTFSAATLSPVGEAVNTCAVKSGRGYTSLCDSVVHLPQLFYL